MESSRSLALVASMVRRLFDRFKESVLAVQEYTYLSLQSLANLFRKPFYLADTIQQATLYRQLLNLRFQIGNVLRSQGHYAQALELTGRLQGALVAPDRSFFGLLRAGLLGLVGVDQYHEVVAHPATDLFDLGDV